MRISKTIRLKLALAAGRASTLVYFRALSTVTAKGSLPTTTRARGPLFWKRTKSSRTRGRYELKELIRAAVALNLKGKSKPKSKRIPRRTSSKGTD